MLSDKLISDLDRHFQLLVLFHFKINVLWEKNKKRNSSLKNIIDQKNPPQKMRAGTEYIIKKAQQTEKVPPP